MSLHLARDLDLPNELVVEKQAILAMSGAGKSNTAVVLAEAMYDAGLPWVAIDPKGDWWGVRAARNGRDEGLRVPVLGGLHGDVPLEPTGGKVIANLIADKRLTCVLDVSEFDTRQDLFRFLADFAETLLKRNTEPLHIFAEEADEYLPQVAREKGNLPRCLGAWQRLVKRGRYRGIGSTLITQRSASINKDVLNMTDTLIVMRTVGIADRKTVKDWVTAHDGNQELLESLPSLADGEAWVYSPQKLHLTQRVKFNRRRTFDSGATPLLDGKAAKVATLADIDLDALKDEMAETIERARADDPTLLRGRIRELERELAKRPTETVTERVEVPVEVSVVPEGAATELRALLVEYDRSIESAAEIAQCFEGVVRLLATAINGANAAPAPRTSPIPRTTSPNTQPSSPSSATRAAPTPRVRPEGLSAQATKMLGVVAGRYPATLSLAQVSALAGYSRRSSSWGPALRELRDGGLIDVNGQQAIATEAGLDALGSDVPAPKSGPEVLAMWADRLDPQPRAFLHALLDGPLSKAELAERTEYSRTSSSFGQSLSVLRKNSLITMAGDVCALDPEFEQAIS